MTTTLMTRLLRLSALLLLFVSACANPAAPVASPGVIDPYAVFYVRDDRPFAPESLWSAGMRTYVTGIYGSVQQALNLGAGVTLPAWYVYLQFPNRPNNLSLIGEVGGSIGPLGQGRDVCGSYSMPTAVPGDLQDRIRVMLRAYPDGSVPNGDFLDLSLPVTDSLVSPTVDPFALGANTYQTPHWFRLWLKADGTTAFEFGRWDDPKRTAAPGWPCGLQ